MHLYILIFLATLVSCSDFGRLNPLDPKADNYIGDGGGGTSSGGGGGSSSSDSDVGNSDCPGFTNGTTRLHYGKNKAQFCDARDNKKYVYTTIGGKIWMAENLNYEASGSVCYNGVVSNCNTYGRLYNWTEVSCPSGWRLPSKDEWAALITSAGNTSTKLKTTSGWNSSGNGTDDYGFSALPGGYLTVDPKYDAVGNIGYWWSATPNSDGKGAWYRAMQYDKAVLTDYEADKRTKFSVRCVRD